MENDRPLPDHAVVIRGDSIAAILPSREAAKLKADKVIDAKGGYLIPGLTDSHAHIGPGNWSFMQGFLNFGVTTVRVAASTETAKAYRDLVKHNLLKGPDLFVAAPAIDGDPPMWGAMHNGPIATKTSDVAGILQNYIDYQQYDMLKLYCNLQPEVYNELLKQAEERNILVTGHIPVDLPKEQILSPRTKSIEHLSGYGRLLYSHDTYPDAVVKKRYDGTYDEEAAQAPDWSKVESAVKNTVAYGIWNCPTLTIYENEKDTTLHAALLKSQLASVYPGLFAWWSSSKTPAITERDKNIIAFRRRVVQELYKGGAPILAGTDTPVPWIVPGFALHQELQTFVEIGFTPFDALKTATVNPARYLKQENKAGKIKVGMKADLLLLAQNPLENISHTLSFKGVIKKGDFITLKPFTL